MSQRCVALVAMKIPMPMVASIDLELKINQSPGLEGCRTAWKVFARRRKISLYSVVAEPKLVATKIGIFG